MPHSAFPSPIFRSSNTGGNGRLPRASYCPILITKPRIPPSAMVADGSGRKYGFSAAVAAVKTETLRSSETALRQKNEALLRALEESLERENRTKMELERMRWRLRLTEDAEERLCLQLGNQEAEAVCRAREYLSHIKALKEKLGQAQIVLHKLDISQSGLEEDGNGS